MAVGSCTICGRELPTPNAAKTHAWRHVREASAILGRMTNDYDEVRKVLGGEIDDVEGPQVSLSYAVLDPEQRTLTEALDEQ